MGAAAVGADRATLAGSGPVSVAHHALAVPVQAGKLDAVNGPYVLGLLDAAIDGALAGRYDAIVTAPLQKSTI
ncbi:4-hydroxythreonine-4-phosphate dehydrogenase PdxA, partial [Mycobacterium tuberculosis]|nr:4-hydroxythreonine-4-phosphate dehydrogenase PdxA [Mycobacterium tuberculosis]